MDVGTEQLLEEMTIRGTMKAIARCIARGFRDESSSRNLNLLTRSSVALSDEFTPKLQIVLKSSDCPPIERLDRESELP